MEFKAKINHKKIKPNNADSAFEEVAEGYKQWMELLKSFNKLSKTEQADFIQKFGTDMNALLLVLYEFSKESKND